MSGDTYRDKLADEIRRVFGHDQGRITEASALTANAVFDAVLSVRDPELDRLSQENDQLRDAHTGVACWESDALWDQERRRAESAEAQLAEAQKKIEDLSSSVRTLSRSLADWCHDDPPSKVIAESIAVDLAALTETNPPPGDTPEPNRSGS